MTSSAKEKMAKEIADIFIYLLSMSHDLKIDLIEAATKKIGRESCKISRQEIKRIIQEIYEFT